MLNLPFQVQFGAKGNYLEWAREGWHLDQNDALHTWAGHLAKLEMDIAPNDGADLVLELDVIPVMAPSVPQELFVFVNGAFVAFFPVRQPQLLRATVEGRFFWQPRTLISFLAPKALRPSEHGNGDDHRILGFAFKSMSLAKQGAASATPPVQEPARSSKRKRV